MSIPLFFAAIRSSRGDIYVDGGLLKNYPVKIFDRSKYVKSNELINTEYYDAINSSIAKLARPISKYVYNKETLGFRLDTKEEIAIFRDHAEPQRNKIKNFKQYTKSLIHTLMEAQLSQHLHSDDWARTIYIDTIGVETTDFDLTEVKKKALIASGKKGTIEYFDWYDSAPINKTPNK